MSRPLRIKLCGVRSARDAVLCAEAGADEVGLIFAARSRRRVTLAQAAAIRAALPGRVPLVGVFQDTSLEELRAALAAVPMAALQLHGAIPPGAAGLGARLCAALQVTGPAALDPLVGLEGIWRVLLDGPRGGSGEPFPWALARQARARFAGELFVAGGLDPANVAAAIRAAAPDGVDVSSGIEGEDGFKDPRRVRAFVEAARGA